MGTSSRLRAKQKLDKMLSGANSPSVQSTKNLRVTEGETSAKPPRRVTKKSSGPDDKMLRKGTASFMSPSMRAQPSDQAKNNEAGDGIDLTKSAMNLGAASRTMTNTVSKQMSSEALGAGLYGAMSMMKQ